MLTWPIALGLLPIFGPLLYGLGWALLHPLADRRRARKIGKAITGTGPSAHQLHNADADTVTVPQLLEREACSRNGYQIGWPAQYLDETGQVRPYAQDQLGTTILHQVPRDDGA